MEKKHSEVLNKQKLIQKYRINVTMNICQYIIFLFPMVGKLRILEHFKNKCKKKSKISSKYFSKQLWYSKFSERKCIIIK